MDKKKKKNCGDLTCKGKKMKDDMGMMNMAKLGVGAMLGAALIGTTAGLVSNAFD